jgi:hypothetical protein
LALVYFPTVAALRLGQLSPLLILLLALAGGALARERPGRAGACLALGLLKPQYALLALLLTTWRRPRALSGFVPVAVALLVAGLAATGLDVTLAYARLLLQISDPRGIPTVSPEVMHNWRGVATRLLGGDPRLIWPMTAVAVAATVALLLAIWWRTPDTHGSAWLVRLSALVPAALLVSPHTNPHDASLLVLPGCWLAVLAFRGIAPRRTTWALLAAGHLLAALGAIVGLRAYADLDVAYMVALLLTLGALARRAPSTVRRSGQPEA